MNGEASTSTRILFVDDSKVMLKTASKILSAEFDVVTAVDGNDAWAKLERDRDIQVMFTDINMPNCDGYALLKKIRSATGPDLRDLPVIMVTGAEEDEAAARQEALDRGATDFLSKKFLSSELLPRARAHATQRIAQKLQAQATLDLLTGLSNEAGILHHLDQDIAYARRHGQGLALMRVQIDDLVRTFQDRGSTVVDQIVVHVAGLIRRRIREEDTAARIGLSGFAISLPGGQRDGIEAMAASLRAQAAENVLEIDGRPFPVSLSTAVIGTEQEIWKNAQEALARCQALLDRPRQRPPMAPIAPVAAPPAPIAAPKPVTVQTTPTRDMPQPSPVRVPPKQVPTPEVPEKTPNVLQRLVSSLRLFGARQSARLVRFLKKLVGR
jgi:two-component system cell cycle response regulator